MADKQSPQQAHQAPVPSPPEAAPAIAPSIQGADQIGPDAALGMSTSGFGMEGVRAMLPSLGQAAAPPEDPKATLDRIRQLPEAGQLGQLVVLLRTGWFDRISPTERWLAMEILEGLSPESREHFVKMGGGALAEDLVAESAPQGAPGPEESWTDLAASAWEGRHEIAHRAGAALGVAGETAGGLIRGEGAQIDLNGVQDAAGGSLGGMRLDARAQNDLEVSGDERDGRVEGRIPSLSVAGMVVSTADGQVIAGRASLKDVFFALDAGSDGHVEVKLGALGWQAITVGLSTLRAFLPGVVLLGMSLRTKRQGGSDEGEDLVARVTTEVTEMARGLLQGVPGIAQAADSGEQAGLAEILRHGFDGAQELHLSIARLDLPGGMRKVNEDGSIEEVGALRLDGVDLSVRNEDTVALLAREKEELSALETRTPAQEERLQWVLEEIERHDTLGRKVEEIAKDRRAGEPLTQEDEDTLTEWRQKEKTGVLDLSVAQISGDGIASAKGGAEGAGVQGVHARVTGQALAAHGADGPGRTSAQRSEALEGALDKRAGREAPEDPDATMIPEGMKVEATTGRVDAKGVAAKGYAAGDVSGESATLLAVGNAQDLTLANADAQDIAGGGMSLDAAGASDVAVSAYGENVGDNVRGTIGGAHAEGLVQSDGTTRTSVGSVDAERASFDYDVAAGNLRSGGVDAVSARDVAYESGGTTAGVDAIDVRGVKATDVDTGALTGQVTADHAEARGIGYDDGDNHARIGAVSADGLAASRTKEGTVAQVGGATADDVEASSASSGIDASVGHVSVGKSGVALDGDDNLVGASVSDLSVSDIHVDLLKYALDDEEGAAAEGPEAVPDRFHGDALAHAGGKLAIRVPLEQIGMGSLAVTVQAIDGYIDMKSIQADLSGRRREDSPFTRLVDGLDGGLRVQAGRGIVYGIGPLSIIFGDTLEYSGLQAGKGHGDRGGIRVQEFAEGIMNGVARAEVDPGAWEELSAKERRAVKREDRREERQERREERKAARGEVEEEEGLQEMVDGYDTYFAEDLPVGLVVDLGAVRVDLTGLKLGDGAIGFDSMQANLDSSGHPGANAFTIRAVLGERAEIGAEEIAASSASAVGPDGLPVDLEALGIRGLRVVVDRPIRVDRQIHVDVVGTEVRAIRLGDTSKLG